MEKRRTQKGNGVLVGVLAVLVLLIVGLVVAIFVVSMPEKKEVSFENEVNEDVANEMEGWDGPIAESTRAMIYADSIEKKVGTEPGFGVDEAIKEYTSAVESSSGEFKLYLAIEYAYYVYDNYKDIKQALEILDSVSSLVNENNELYYYGVLYDMYNSFGDTANAERYKKLVDEKSKVDKKLLEENMQ